MPGDAFDIENKQLMGRRVAGLSMIKGILSRLENNEYLEVLTTNNQENQILINALKGTKYNKSSLKLFNECNPKSMSNLFIPDPMLSKWQILRSRYQSNLFSITGIIHTLCTNNVMKEVGNLITSPSERWDALICTSSSGKRVVEKTIEYNHEYLEKRLNTKLTKNNLPKLPIIPLATDDIYKEKDINRESDRIKARKELHIPFDAFVILYIGRLSWNSKNHPLPIYRSISKVKLKNPNKKIIFIECGSFGNKKNLEYSYNDLANKSSLDIRRIGGLNNASEEKKNLCLRSADIFLSPSDNIQETFGLTVIEAMSAGLPVIASDWNGYKDLVTDEITGYLIPTYYYLGEHAKFDEIESQYRMDLIDYDSMVGVRSLGTVVDEEKIINAINSLLNNRNKRIRMGEAARLKWQNNFSWNVIDKQYRNLWNELDETRKDSKVQNSPKSCIPTFGYLFEGYGTAIYQKEYLKTNQFSTSPDILLHPLHKQFCQFIVGKNILDLIELIKTNGSINKKNLLDLNIPNEKHISIFSLLEKLGIAQ